jgi:probable HAF family extracellular repeat protein
MVAYSLGLVSFANHFFPKYAALFNLHPYTTFGYISLATGINAKGQVVGYAENSSGSYHAFLYDNGMMADLNDLVAPASEEVRAGGKQLEGRMRE